MTTTDEPTDEIVLRLRERTPEYLTVFAVGLAASVGMDLFIG